MPSLDAAPAGRSWLRDLFTGFPPEVRTDSGGGVAISFPTVRSARDAARLGAEVFALPGRIAARLKRPIVIALDEFQAITSYEESGVEDALRAAVQQQRQVGYVFAGSEPSLMEQMVVRGGRSTKPAPSSASARLPRTPSRASLRIDSGSPASRRNPASAPPSSMSAATFRTTCSASRTKPGTTRPR